MRDHRILSPEMLVDAKKWSVVDNYPSARHEANAKLEAHNRAVSVHLSHCWIDDGISAVGCKYGCDDNCPADPRNKTIEVFRIWDTHDQEYYVADVNRHGLFNREQDAKSKISSHSATRKLNKKDRDKQTRFEIHTFEMRRKT